MDIKAFAANSGDQLALLAFWAETVIARKMTAKEHKYFFMLNFVLSDTKIRNLHKASIVNSATNKPEVMADAPATHGRSLFGSY